MKSDRAERIADAALRVLAERGMRGLTHRAVDEAAGLPQGSTSNLARTRLALLLLVLNHVDAVDAAQFSRLPGAVLSPRELAEQITDGAMSMLTGDRLLLLARYELALEATRRPQLRERYDEIGLRRRERAIAVLATQGSPQPHRHGRLLVTIVDGILFDTVAGAGEEPTRAQLLDSIGEVLRGMLPGTTRDNAE